MESRRQFLKKVALLGGSLILSSRTFANGSRPQKRTLNAYTTLYRAVNGTPADNLEKVVELMGGIEKIIGLDDIVVIKPNVQWWNQGAPNILTLKALAELIMDRPGGFKGELVIAENCHRGPTPWLSLSSGWARPFALNSGAGLAHFNDLANSLKRKYGQRYSTCHWVDADAGGKRICRPEDGEGYVYCDGTAGVPLITCENGLMGEASRSTIMTYPIFATDKGTIIDFKNGVWKKGAYTGRPLRFINLAALNHHSPYCGATSAVKNYMGIADLSGGADPHRGGLLTGGYYNFHAFAFDRWANGPRPGMVGAAMGVFMNEIRKADLNITTAEWVGLGSRTGGPAAHTRAVLACRDPVALDYHASKYLLYPNSGCAFHDPDDKKGPLYQYLLECADKGGGLMDERQVMVKSFDFRKKGLQGDGGLAVYGEKRWGNDLKSILKYLLLRFGWG